MHTALHPNRFQCYYQRTCQLSDDYFRCMYSSVLDDEGTELMSNPRKNELTALFKASTEEQKLGLAFIDDATGYGVFALEAFKAGDYVCSYCGLLAGNDNIKDQVPNCCVTTTVVCLHACMHIMHIHAYIYIFCVCVCVCNIHTHVCYVTHTCVFVLYLSIYLSIFLSICL